LADVGTLRLFARNSSRVSTAGKRGHWHDWPASEDILLPYFTLPNLTYL